MAGKVGGSGNLDPRVGGPDLHGVEAVDGHGAGADASAGDAAAGAANATRTNRPKSVDMAGLGLAAALAAKLDAAPDARPIVVKGPPVPLTVKGPPIPIAVPRPVVVAHPIDPRPHVGAADAKVIEQLIAAKDPVKMTNEILARARKLFVCDSAGLRLAPGATAGEVNRFKVFLDVVTADGKLGDFRKFLSESPGSSVLLDGKPLAFGVNADDILSLLVKTHGGRGVQQTWAKTPPPATPPNAGLVDAQVLEQMIDGGDAAGAANQLFYAARALFTVDASGAHLRPNAKPGEVRRFQQMLTQLEDHAKIPDLRQLLGRAAGSAAVQLDGAPLPRNVTPDDIGNVLVHAFGTFSQQLRWDRAPPP